MDCGRPLNDLPTRYKENDICMDCVRWINEEDIVRLKIARCTCTMMR